MSNFAARLDELMEAVKTEQSAFKRYAYVQQMDAFLVNHATAIRDLVKAAEECSKNYISDEVAGNELREALAKLEEA